MLLFFVHLVHRYDCFQWVSCQWTSVGGWEQTKTLPCSPPVMPDSRWYYSQAWLLLLFPQLLLNTQTWQPQWLLGLSAGPVFMALFLHQSRFKKLTKFTQPDLGRLWRKGSQYDITTSPNEGQSVYKNMGRAPYIQYNGEKCPLFSLHKHTFGIR